MSEISLVIVEQAPACWKTVHFPYLFGYFISFISFEFLILDAKGLIISAYNDINKLHPCRIDRSILLSFCKVAINLCFTFDVSIKYPYAPYETLDKHFYL